MSISKSDKIIISFVFFLSVISFAYLFFISDSNKGQYIVIADKNKELYRVSFKDVSMKGSFEKTFFTKTGDIIFNFDAEKGVGVVDASCPDKICQHSPYINKNNQMIVCVPGEIFATIVSEDKKDGDVDAVLR